MSHLCVLFISSTTSVTTTILIGLHLLSPWFVESYNVLLYKFIFPTNTTHFPQCFHVSTFCVSRVDAIDSALEEYHHEFYKWSIRIAVSQPQIVGTGLDGYGYKDCSCGD